jgi:chromosome segregation ATPase
MLPRRSRTAAGRLPGRVADIDDQRRRVSDARRNLDRAHDAHDEARRESAGAQERLGEAEDELTAAASGRDWLEEGETPAPAALDEAEARVGRAEDAWAEREAEAKSASGRRDEAAGAEDDARASLDECNRDAPYDRKPK